MQGNIANKFTIENQLQYKIAIDTLIVAIASYVSIILWKQLTICYIYSSTS